MDPRPHATDRPDPAAQLAQLNAAIPEPLAARIRGARLVGERKPVTALFADIVGSTSLAEVIDPEDWTEIINAAFEVMSRAVFTYEGTIAQLQGDAMICFFGAPVAHEDDPERAVRAALAMAAAIDAYARDLKRSQGIDFAIRIGISTGLVLVGNVGSDLRFDYTAIGDTMNTAARLQAASPPGGITISEKTHRFVATRFAFDLVGALDLKGKAEAVTAYRVIGALAEPGPSRGLAGLSSPMVGRDADLRRLTGLCDAVRAGRGRVAVVIGEPGIGKSRLVSELRAVIASGQDGDGVAWVTGQALSYGRTMALHLVEDVVRRLIGVGPGNSSDEVAAALDARLDALMPDEAGEQRAYLRHLLGLPVLAADADRIARLEPLLLQDRTFGGGLRLIRATAARGPLVVAFEDLHWADGTSAEFVKGLLAVVDELPLMLLLTTREEHGTAGWDVVRVAREQFGRALTEVALAPLDAAEARRLVANLLEIESLPAAMRELILAKAEGNPFFVEEVIRMLLDRGAIERLGDRWVATGAVEGIAIPDTLHGLVLARIDRLPAEARSALRVASVIDRQFSVPLLEAVLSAAGDERPVGPALGRLEASDLLTLASVDPDVEYRFSHALIQDAAYESMLKQERREWHRLVAAELERRSPERRRELAARLGRHHELAGDAPAAIAAYQVAAEDALARAGSREAFELASRAAALLPPLAEPGGLAVEPLDLVEQRARIALGRVGAGFAFLPVAEALAIAEEGRAAAERLGDVRLLADAAFWEAWLLRASGATPDSNAALRDALARAATYGDQAGDAAYRGRPLLLMAEIALATGAFRSALAHLDEAEPFLRSRRDFVGASMLFNLRAGAHALLGEFARAETEVARSAELAEEGDELSRIDARLSRAMVDRERGDWPTSIRYASECLEEAEAIGSLSCAAMASLALGGSQLGSRQPGAARDTLERGLDLSIQSHLTAQRLSATAMLSEIDGLQGKLERAEAGWRGALEGFGALGDGFSVADVRLGRGSVLALGPDPDPGTGLADLDAAIAALESLEALPRLARALRVRARVLHRLGRDAEAEASLARAADLAERIGLLDGPWPRAVTSLDQVTAVDLG